MPSRKYNPGSIRQLILSAGPFKASLSASDRNRVGTIWAQLSSDSELQYITIPEELVRKLGRLVSSSSPNEQWIEKFESAWRKYKALTGSRITFADFAQAAHTCMLESARAKGTLTQNPSVNIKMTLPTGNNPRKDTFAGRGIANLGQTCYLGATVQFATGCEPFFGAFVQTPFPDQKIPDSTHGQSEDAKKLMLARELRTILIQAEDTKADGPLNPEKLERCLLAVKQDWTRGNQQDAHEAWLTLQGALHACTNRAEGQVESFQYPVNEDIVATADRNWDSIRKFQSDSCAERPFLGQYAMERACRDCGTPKPVTFGSSTVTHLKMPKRIRQAAVIANKPLTIMDLLHENYAAEIVELKCETCGKSSFSQDESIMHLPQYLVFMIARFENGPDGVKFKDRVHFEVDGLDVHEFVHPRRRTLDHPKYDCRAVIHHLGDTLRSGHYVTYLREEKSDEEESRWVLYNDEVVLLVGDQAEIMVSH